MDIHTATEVAFKNGYEKGYAEGKAAANSVNVRCEKCGKDMSLVNVLTFNRDGSDSEHLTIIDEADEDAVVIDATPNWVGNGLSEEEMLETIRCPHCGKFPFKSEEIQVYEIMRIVCFKTGEENKDG